MLQNEFEKLMGEVVSTEEYIQANAMYMFVDDIDKEQFVKQYKKIRGVPLVKELFNMAKIYKNENHKLHEKLDDAIELLLDIGSDPNIDQEWVDLIDKRAEMLLDRKTIITKKCSKGYVLTSGQLDYVVQHLQ